MRTRLAILALAAGMSLGGCAYGGMGLGSGYGPYGAYGNPYGNGISYSIGYGNGYGYSPYGYSPYGYSPYGYGGYGMPYYGWYNDFYYPGTGYYVYDSDKHPRVWTDAEKAYWTERLRQAQTTNGITKVPNNSQMRAVWDAFHRQPNSDTVFVPTNSQQTVRTLSDGSRTVSSNRASNLERRGQNRIERSERRAERMSVRSTSSSDARSDRRSRKN